MSEMKLKLLLENLINEIETNHNLSLEEIINKLSIEIESYMLVQELN